MLHFKYKNVYLNINQKNMKKTKAGRPKTGVPTVQKNVTMAVVKMEDPRLKDKIKYTSFSNYVNSLIDNDLMGVPTLNA